MGRGANQSGVFQKRKLFSGKELDSGNAELFGVFDDIQWSPFRRDNKGPGSDDLLDPTIAGGTLLGKNGRSERGGTKACQEISSGWSHLI